MKSVLRRSVVVCLFLFSVHQTHAQLFQDVITSVNKRGVVGWYGLGTYSHIGAAIKYGEFTLFEDTAARTIDTIFNGVDSIFDANGRLTQVQKHFTLEKEKMHWLHFNLSAGYKQFTNFNIGDGKPLSGTSSMGGVYLGIFTSTRKDWKIRPYIGFSATVLSETTINGEYTGRFKPTDKVEQDTIGIPIRATFPAKITKEYNFGLVIYDNFIVSVLYHDINYEKVAYKDGNDKSIQNSDSYKSKINDSVDLSHWAFTFGFNFTF